MTMGFWIRAGWFRHADIGFDGVEHMTLYRPLTDDEDELFRSYTRYAFRPQLSPDQADESPTAPRTVGERRGLFIEDDARPRAVCAHFWFESCVRGVQLSTPGLSAVATPPEYRRQGYARELFVHTLEEYRERGDHLSILWPFKFSFYRDLGWAEAYRYAHHEVEPAALRTVGGDTTGSFHRIDPDDIDLLDPIYRAFTQSYDLAIHRDETWWRKRIAVSWWGEHYIYVWRDDDGVDRGYLVFRYEGDHRDRELIVYDFAASDATAYRQLCRFLADHDSQTDRVKLFESIDTPLLDHLRSRAGVETSVNNGAMVRLVDAKRTLEAIEYPQEASASVVLQLDDDLVDWHEEPIRLDVSDGSASVEQISADPEVILDIGTLSAMVVGARPVSRYVDAGEIEGEPAAVAALDATFPPRSVWCLDWF